jgi:hypothetical protein
MTRFDYKSLVDLGLGLKKKKKRKRKRLQAQGLTTTKVWST